LKNSLRFSFLLPVTRWFADRLNQELYCKNWFDMFFRQIRFFRETSGQRKILRGISDKILSLCETNESSAIMETNGYRLLLPEGTLDYFNISDVKESSSEIVIYLEEKNELPGEYSTVKVESKGFYDPVVVRDFPIRGKNLFLNIRRRRWILKDEGRYVSRNWKLVAEGSRMTHEFASFLKELY